MVLIDCQMLKEDITANNYYYQVVRMKLQPGWLQMT